MYTGFAGSSLYIVQGLQCETDSLKILQCMRFSLEPRTHDHLNNDHKNKNFISIMETSTPSIEPSPSNVRLSLPPYYPH